MTSAEHSPAVWFPAVRAGSGTDAFTERLAKGLSARGIRTEITWLPLRAEYAPWTVPVPEVPSWASIVHVNSWLHPRFLPTDLPVISTLHCSVHDLALRPYKRPSQRLYHAGWIRRLEVANLCRADYVVAVSHYTAKAALEAFGPRKIEVIHNGVDTKRFRPVERVNPNQPFRLLYVGNWSRRKGVDLLSGIMQKLGEGFELLYTTDRGGAHVHYALPANCHALGRLSGRALVSAYQQADALLFPSRLEGLPLTVLEAMACGIPVIAAETSSLPEVVENGLTGLLCPPDDIGAISDAARRLAADVNQWRSLRKAARQDVEARFNMEMMIDRYLALYRRMSAEASLTSRVPKVSV